MLSHFSTPIWSDQYGRESSEAFAADVDDGGDESANAATALPVAAAAAPATATRLHGLEWRQSGLEATISATAAAAAATAATALVRTSTRPSEWGATWDIYRWPPTGAVRFNGIIQTTKEGKVETRISKNANPCVPCR